MHFDNIMFFIYSNLHNKTQILLNLPPGKWKRRTAKLTVFLFYI